MQYVKLRRLDQASILLLDEAVAASQVGYCVGYASPAHFSRDFKRRFGIAPSLYLKTFAANSIVALD